MDKVESIIERTIRELEKRGYNVKSTGRTKPINKSQDIDIAYAKKIMSESAYRIHDIAKDKAQYQRMYYVMNSTASFSHEDAMAIIDFHMWQLMGIQKLIHEYLKEKTEEISQ